MSTHPMSTTVGSGRYTYDVDADWAKLPAGWSMPAAAVTVDSRDRVYCFNRTPDHPVVVFDRDGNYLSSWAPGCSRSRTRSASTPTTTSGSSTATTDR